MKKMFTLTMLLFAMTTATMAQHEAPKIQGVPHHVHRSRIQSAVSRQVVDSTLTFSDVECWVGAGSDSSLLVIQFNDNYAKGSLVWGYRYNAINPDTSDSTTVFDMLKAVAKADPRLTVMVQYDGYSGGYYLGWSVGGFGFNQCGKCTRVEVEFDYDGAYEDSASDTAHIQFHYVDPPNTAYGQTSTPGGEGGTLALVNPAIADGYNNGVIYHPLDYTTFGYPAYDFDYWYEASGESCQRWQSGWYYKYWAFYIAPSYPFSFGYSSYSVDKTVLTNGGATGFYLCADMTTYCSGETISGPYTYVSCPCSATSKQSAVKSKKK